MIPLVFLTAGGTALDVLGLLQDVNDQQPTFQPLGFLDDAPQLQGATLHGLDVLGPLADFRKFKDAVFLNCLGSPANHWRRGSIIEPLGIPEKRFATMIHPTAVVSRMSTIGAGTIIYPHVFVGTGVRVGRQSLLMSHVSINHDAVIGDYSIIASGALVLGKVTIGDHAYVGAGSAIHQNVSIGRRALIGMGGIVLKDVPDGDVVVGTPVRFLRTTPDERPESDQ